LLETIGVGLIAGDGALGVDVSDVGSDTFLIVSDGGL